MANQINRLTYALGKGGALRMLFKPAVGSTQMTLVVLQHGMCSFRHDPMNEEMTEGDSYGRYLAPTLEMNEIRVDLRRRQGPVSLDALGVRALSLVDAVFLDIGTTGTGDLLFHMTPGEYSRGGPQSQQIAEGFSLSGGALVGRGIAIPSYMQAAVAVPDIGGYTRSGISVPSGL